jgi:ubiquitin-conjugating enzyme E2 S
MFVLEHLVTMLCNLVSTPYEGGTFKVKLSFTADYPSLPPIGYFVTKIFHPNVSKDGQICVNTLKKDWKPDLDIKHILLVIR